ncbi:MAG: MBL fold metallo-hydrolase [Lachnospiraceae bacterium]|nr:MBL fold metallo-hydrolase [Lachnospiraceae bacterium]
MANLITITNVLGSLGTNCYTVANTETREALVVDPAARGDFLIEMYKNQNLKPVAILLTHGHFDHVGAVKDLKAAYPDIKIYAGVEEEDILKRPELNLSMMFGANMSLEADCYVADGEEIELLGTQIKCINVPGHTKGGTCFYFADDRMVFSGDTLFYSSIGRSDFPTGNERDLLDNIEKKLLTLPEDVTVYPGHNDRTSIKREKAQNPYF